MSVYGNKGSRIEGYMSVMSVYGNKGSTDEGLTSYIQIAVQNKDLHVMVEMANFRLPPLWDIDLFSPLA